MSLLQEISLIFLISHITNSAGEMACDKGNGINEGGMHGVMTLSTSLQMVLELLTKGAS
jgi:hypothetical protein